jgi:hypothetical protein
MYRSVLLPALAMLGLVTACGRPLTAKQEARQDARGLELRDKLGKPVDYQGIDDPKVTLQEVLDQLAQVYDLSFDVNEKAFRDVELGDVHKYEVACRQPIPRMNTSLGNVLQKILSRVGDSRATYVFRKDVIEITTWKAVRAEFYPNRDEGLLLSLIHADFNERPLDEALRELARSSGISIIVDKQIAKTAKTPITAEFSNVPLDTAVRLLANMITLKMVQVDNVLYVTTKENAAELAAEDAMKAKRQKPKESSDPGPSKPETSDNRTGNKKL